MIRTVLRTLVLWLVPGVLAAQSWRNFDVAHQSRDTASLAVHVTYGAGRVSLRPDSSHNLYDVHLRYDADRTGPVYHFDPGTRQLEIGIRRNATPTSMRHGDQNELNILLARTTPLRLALDVGAAEGDYDLSGLRIDELSLQTGASDTRVHFDAPNPRRMRSMRVDAGAASVRLSGLANANAEHIDVNLGVGKVALNFDGEWRTDVQMSVNSALGEITVSVPSDVGVRVTSSSFLHAVDAPGLTKSGGALVSDNWASAKHRLEVRASGALGHLEIARVDR